MNYWTGIDGGGSSLRVVIVDDDLQIVAQVNSKAANPSSIGHALAAERIRTTTQQALLRANQPPIAGIGMGIAGADAAHSLVWGEQVLASILPNVPAIVASDYEIALVGARGVQHGALLLSGTGSIAFGINTAGKQHRAGGWGYLLGDEGSGFWLGLEALKIVSRLADGRVSHPDIPPFCDAVLQTLGLSSWRDGVGWLYHQPGIDVPAVAKIAPLVLEWAHDENASAREIVVRGAHHLVELAHTVLRKLNMDKDTLAFAGGLLSHRNVLSNTVVDLLNLAQYPVTKYSPAVGAALLAKLKLRLKT